MSLVISAGTFLKRKDAVHPFGASGVPSLGNSLFAPLRSPLTAGEAWLGPVLWEQQRTRQAGEERGPFPSRSVRPP